MLYYRISDKGYQKSKLIGATKEVCLMNFCKAFSEQIFKEDPEILVIADRCDRPTIKMLVDAGLPLEITDLGNAGSFRHALKLALEREDDELIYFCEDDYLHLGSAPQLLKEGIKRAEYVTLYDHPDKYTRLYNGGEFSKVIKTTSSHWRYTCSTCMTFGSTVKILKEDLNVWEKHTNGNHPHDHKIFTELGEKNRRLAVCLPGVACHTDLDFSSRMGTVLIDDWAIELMISELEFLLQSFDQEIKNSVIKDRSGWSKLVALDALLKTK